MSCSSSECLRLIKINWQFVHCEKWKMTLSGENYLFEIDKCYHYCVPYDNITTIMHPSVIIYSRYLISTTIF